MPINKPKRVKLCGKYSCNICFNKSFASYTGLTKLGKLKIKCWDNIKNNDTPITILQGICKKYWFICDYCGHNFESLINNVTGKKNRWCPYCCVPSQKLCNDKKCKFCHNNSFASYNDLTVNNKLKIKCWNNNKNNITPRFVMKYSNKKYWFSCDKCHHDFISTLSGISTDNKWCPYCANSKLCGDSNCGICFTPFNI